jgi:hypothetical protein
MFPDGKGGSKTI